jgi:formylglycine-generating enzyme required for sulfatase activity
MTASEQRLSKESCLPAPAVWFGILSLTVAMGTGCAARSDVDQNQSTATCPPSSSSFVESGREVPSVASTPAVDDADNHPNCLVPELLMVDAPRPTGCQIGNHGIPPAPPEGIEGGRTGEFEWTSGSYHYGETKDTRVRPFQISATEITIEMWNQVMADTDAMLDVENECAQCPVTGFRFQDAAEFMNRLSDLDGRSRCYALEPGPDLPRFRFGDNSEIVFENRACTGYRLPLPEEWECAARAGSTGVFPDEWMDEEGSCIEEIAETYANARRVPSSLPPPPPPLRAVATGRPNALGLYDTLGNASELVRGDLYGRPYLSAQFGLGSGEACFAAGWDSGVNACFMRPSVYKSFGCYHLNSVNPAYRVGLRVVRARM